MTTLENIARTLREIEAEKEAMKKAVNARISDLVKAGVDRSMARIIANAEKDSGLIRPVVI